MATKEIAIAALDIHRHIAPTTLINVYGPGRYSYIGVVYLINGEDSFLIGIPSSTSTRGWPFSAMQDIYIPIVAGLLSCPTDYHFWWVGKSRSYSVVPVKPSATYLLNILCDNLILT